MEDTNNQFISIYKKYLETGDQGLFEQLQSLLRVVEKEKITNSRNSRSAVAFPEEGFIRPIGWQVMRDTEFIFIKGESREIRFRLGLGEMILYHPHWNRDVFVSRYIHKELMSGQVCRIGRDWKNIVDEEKYLNSQLTEAARDALWETGGPVDEPGLYLPIYSKEDFQKIFWFNYEKYRRERIQDYFDNKSNW